jgi:repressor LexA
MALTRRQKQILDFIQEFITTNGYSPSLEEIGRHLGLSSVATVHKHVTNLVRKGLLRRAWNQHRSLEVVAENQAPRAVVVPLVAAIPAGRPGEAVGESETLSIPAWLVGPGRTYALQVSGESMVDEQIRNGDFVIIEEQRSAEGGELVVALLHGEDLALRKYYLENDAILLQPADRSHQPVLVAPDRVEVRGVVRGVIRKC